MGTELAKPNERLNELLATPGIKGRFTEMLKDRAPSFISSIISAVKGNKALTECDPMSVIAASAVAASLDLPINPSLGFAYIVPYSGQATFQMGYLGYVQLFLRSGQANKIHALAIHEGDIKNINRLTGDIELSPDEHIDSPVIGYLAYFRLKNGFEHFLYMTKEQMEKHARQYSRSYSYDLSAGKKSSKWSTDFEQMALKTVTKMNLKKYAPLSVEVRDAIAKDEAIEVDGEVVHPDNLQESITPTPAVKPQTSARLANAVAPTVPKVAQTTDVELVHDQEDLPI